MPNEAKQRFLDLVVGEISIVDTPANEVEFLVVKRLTEGEMATEQQTTAKAAENTGAEVVNLQADGEGDNVAKALEQVNTLVQTIAKSIKDAAAPAPAAPAAPAAAAPAAPAADVEKAKKGKQRDMYKAQLEKAGVKDKDLEKAMSEYDGAEPAEQPTTKAAEPAPAPAVDTEEATAQKALELLGVAIAKAKTFTPKRQDALKAAVEQLQTLMAELAPAPAAGQTPAADIGNSGLVALTKAIGDLTKTVTESIETTKALGERVTKVEQTREAPTALGNEGTDTQETKKSFWHGVL